jgi:hypothetical protein
MIDLFVSGAPLSLRVLRSAADDGMPQLAARAMGGSRPEALPDQ